MFFNKKFYYKYFSYTKYLLILFSFWISINTGSKYVEIDNLNWHISNNTFNFVRAILPYIFLIYYFIYENKNYNNKINNFDIVFKLFFLYGSCQILGLIYKFDDLHEHYWIVSLFSVLIFYNLIKEKHDENLFNFIFFINIIAILLIFSIFIFITFKINIISENLLYDSGTAAMLYKTEYLPRSSGLSRMALLLFIFFNSLYFSKKFNKKLNIYLITANILLVSIIFLFQSRGTLLSFVFIFIGIIIFYRLKNIIQYFCLMILIPIIVFVSYPNIKNILIEKYDVNKEDIKAQKKIKLKNFEINLRDNLLSDGGQKIEIIEPGDSGLMPGTISDKLKFVEINKKLISENKNIAVGKIVLNEGNLLNKIESISNNRVNAWNFLLQIFFKNKLNEKMKNQLINAGYNLNEFKKIRKKNFITGFGPQADRHLMFNTSKLGAAAPIKGPFGYNASNGVIYSLVCSGLLGMFSFIIINLIIFFKIIKLLIHHFKMSNLNSKPFLSASIFSILFLQMRVLYENSFSIFGVDLIIFISAYIIVQNEYRKLSN